MDDLLYQLIRLFRAKNISGPLALLLDFLNYSQVRLKQDPQLSDLLNHLKHDENGRMSKSQKVTLAFKVIKVLGYEYFSDKESNCAHWYEYDLERIKTGHGKYYSDEESISWNSKFDDRDEICRSSVRSFQINL